MNSLAEKKTTARIITQVMAELIIADASGEMKCSDRDDLADKTRFAEWEPLHVREVVRPADHGITPPHHPDILKQPPPALESGRRGDGLAGPVWTVSNVCVCNASE